MISRSPKRHSFQMESYIKRCQEQGQEPSQDYLDMFLQVQRNDNSKFNDPATHIDNLEYDLLTTDWILTKVRDSEIYAQNLYAAMCNNEFVKNDVWPLLIEKKWHCSWRYAGGIIADMRQKGDYIDWYCSGIKNTLTDDELKILTKEQLERYNITEHFVGESTVTEEIKKDLFDLGWLVLDLDNE